MLELTLMQNSVTKTETVQQKSFLETAPIGKLLWQMSLPMIIAMMINALYGIVDRAFVGNLPGVGTLAIAGVGLTLPASLAAFALAMLTGSGTAILISLALGEKDSARAQNIFNNGVEFTILLSLITTFIFLFFLTPILRFLGADNQTLPFAYSYSVIVLWGIVFSSLAFCLTAVMRSLGDPKTATIFMIISTLLNIVLDYLLMFGWHLGIAGAAIATVISQIVNAILCLHYFWRGKSSLHFPKINFKINFQVYTKIALAGTAGFSTQIAAASINVLINNILLNVGGNLAIGAITIINTLSMFFILPLVGVSQGLQPIVGYNYGAGNYARVRHSLKKAFWLMTAFSLAAMLIIQLWPTALIKLFTSDQQLISLTISGLRLFNGAMFLLPIYFICSNYYQFIGRGLTASILSLLRQVIIFAPTLFFAAHFFGLTGVWWSGPISDTLSTLLVALIFYHSYQKLKNKPDKNNGSH